MHRGPLYPQSRQSAKPFLQSLELGLPHPLTRIRPFGSGGKAHLLAGEGVGDPNSDAGTSLWYSRYLLCGSFYFVVEKLCNGVVWCGSSDFMKL